MRRAGSSTSGSAYVNTAAARSCASCRRHLGRSVLEVMPRAWDDRGRLEMYIEALDRNEVRRRSDSPRPTAITPGITSSPRRSTAISRCGSPTSRSASRRSATLRRGRPPQGRVPGHAGARAAQSAGADPPGRHDRAQSRTPPRRSGAGRTTSSSARCSTCRCCSTTCSTSRASRTARCSCASSRPTCSPSSARRSRPRARCIDERQHQLDVDVPEAPAGELRSAAPGAGAVQPADQCGEVHQSAGTIRVAARSRTTTS